MHEWAIAQGVVTAISKIADERGKTVYRVKIVVGELSGYELDVLNTALKSLSMDTPLSEALFEIVVEPTRFKCNFCGFKWGMDEAKKQLAEIFGAEDAETPMHYVPELAVAFLKCPKCGAPDFTIISGRGVRVAEVELA